MKRVRKSKQSTPKNSAHAHEEAAVPFIPAWDLLEAEQDTLSESEAAAVALALLEQGVFSDDALSERHTTSPWAMQARIAGISRRL